MYLFQSLKNTEEEKQMLKEEISALRDAAVRKMCHEINKCVCIPRKSGAQYIVHLFRL